MKDKILDRVALVSKVQLSPTYRPAVFPDHFALTYGGTCWALQFLLIKLVLEIYNNKQLTSNGLTGITLTKNYSSAPWLRSNPKIR